MASTATIRVSGLRRRTLAALQSQAKAEGLSLEGYLRELIENETLVGQMARRKTIDQVLAPVQRQFRESGMAEEELDRLVDAARTEHHKRVTKRKKN